MLCVLTANLSTILVGSEVCGLVGLSVRAAIRDRRSGQCAGCKGCSGCSGSCHGCHTGH